MYKIIKSVYLELWERTIPWAELYTLFKTQFQWIIDLNLTWKPVKLLDKKKKAAQLGASQRMHKQASKSTIIQHKCWWFDCIKLEYFSTYFLRVSLSWFQGRTVITTMFRFCKRIFFSFPFDLLPKCWDVCHKTLLKRFF